MLNLVLACVAGGAVSLIVGFIWYHPKVFGTLWMKETGLTEEDAAKSNMVLVFGLAFLITAYMTYEMKWINHPDETLSSVLHGMFHGVKHVGLFAVGALIINALFEHKSVKYILINVGYWIVVFGVIGAVLTSFPSFKEKENTVEPAESSDGEETGFIDQSNKMEDSDQIFKGLL